MLARIGQPALDTGTEMEEVMMTQFKMSCFDEFILPLQMKKNFIVKKVYL